MSVCRAYSQIGSSRNFVVKSVEANSSPYGDLFIQADFDAWLAANPGAIAKLGTSRYVVKDPMNFEGVVADSTPLTATYQSILANYDSYTLQDMGNDIVVGTVGSPRLLVFRSVKMPADSASYATGLVGYVVVENNTSDVTRPRFRVAVARA